MSALLNRRRTEGANGPDRAVIDIGSNTVRMVVYGGPARAPDILLNEKVTARLGRDIATTGNLSDKAQAVALAGLRRFHALLQATGVKDVTVVATAAARDTANGPEFLRQVRAIGFAPRLLTGEEEAIAAAAGVRLELTRLFLIPAQPFDAGCIDLVRQGAAKSGFSSREIVSGAGHDAVYVAGKVPTAMIFIPCEDGISHNEVENISPADGARGAAVLFETLVATAGRP